MSMNARISSMAVRAIPLSFNALARVGPKRAMSVQRWT